MKKLGERHIHMIHKEHHKQNKLIKPVGGRGEAGGDMQTGWSWAREVQHRQPPADNCGG